MMEEIQVSHNNDPDLQGINQNLEKGKSPGFFVHEDGTLRFQNHLCVSKNMGIRKQILDKAHSTRYLAHLGGTSMYRDLRQFF